MYIDPESSYGKSQYAELLDSQNSSVPMKWVTNKATGVSHVTFNCGETTIWACYNDPITGVTVFVDMMVLDWVGNEVERQCTYKFLNFFFAVLHFVAWSAAFELHILLSALGCRYVHFIALT